MEASLKRIAVYWFATVILLYGRIEAQTIAVSLSMNPNPPIEFYRWNEMPVPFQMFVNNASTASLDVKFHFEIKAPGGQLLAKTETSSEPVITLHPGFNTISGSSVFSTDYFTIAKEFQNTLGKDKTFPEGNFDFCVIVTNTGGTSVSFSPSCAPFHIYKYESPVLIYPPNEALLCGNDLTQTVFQWSPAVSTNPFNTGYFHFVLCEILEGQSPGEAILANIPVVEQLLPTSQNQWIWPENLIIPNNNSDYVWGVNIFSYNDVMISNFSETFTTRCRKDTAIYLRDTLQIDTVKTPTTIERPPTITVGNKCSDPGYQLKPASKVSLGIVLDNATLAPYPRAVPIRAEGIDWDLMIPLCSGCKGGSSENPIAVKDEVGDYQWRLLSDKGSLNTPFDLKEIDTLTEAITRIEERIRQITDSIESMQKELEKGLDEKKAALEARIEQKKKDKKAIEDQKKKNEKTSDSLTTVLKKKEKEIQPVKNALKALNDEIAKTLEQIKLKEKALIPKPGTAESNLSGFIGRQQESLKNLNENLKAKELEWMKSLEKLQQEMIKAQEVLQQQVTKYNAAKDNLEALARKVSSFETSLMSTADGKIFYSGYLDWNKKTQLFINTFSANPTVAKTQRTNMQNMAANVLSVTGVPVRVQRASEFENTLNQFNSSLAMGCASGCANALAEVRNSGNYLINVLKNLAPGNFLLDAKMLVKMDSLRLSISNQQGSLTPYKNAVDKAVNDYENARDQYANSSSDNEKERTDYQNKIAKAETELTNLQKQYKEAVEARKKEEDDKRETTNKEINDLKNTLQSQKQKIFSMSDSIQKMEMTIDRLKADISDTKDEIEKNTNEIKSLDDLIKKLEDQKKDLKNEKDRLEKKIKTLQDEKKSLEEKLKALKNKKDLLLKGNKSASGPFVYYIPPPLEEIIKDKDTFEKLKDSVAMAEAKLVVSYNAKEAVQGKIVKEIEKTAKTLVAYNDASKSLSSLEKKVTQLSDDLSKTKTKKHQDFLDDQAAAQKAVTDEKAKAEKADAEEIKATEDAKKGYDELEQKKQKVSSKKEALQKATENILDKKAQLELEEKQLANARDGMKNASQNLRKEDDNITRLELELNRAKNDLTRASALKDEKEIAKVIQKITSLEQELKQSKENKLPALQAASKSAELNVENAVKRYNAAETADKEAFKEYDKLAQELTSLSEEVNKTSELTEAKKNKMYQKIREKNKAEADFEIALKNKEKMKEEVNSKVDDDADIKKANDKKAEAESQKAKTEEIIKKAENDIKESLALKAKWIKEADEALNNAKETLKKAKEKLHDFLLKEFNTVNLEVTLELRANDKVADKWRSKDGIAILTNKLTYPGTRIPNMRNIHPDESAPVSESIRSVCIPEISFLKPSDAMVSIPSEVKEPRTIALIYKEGEPLWKEWPVLDKKTPLLAKDVIPVNSGGNDNDQMIIKCVAASGICQPTASTDNIRDLGSYIWESDGVRLGDYGIIPLMIWQTAKVEKPLKEIPQEVKVHYIAKDFASDDEKKASKKPNVKAGVLIECSKDTTGAPKQIYKMQGRVVNGEHKGLDAEEIEFEVKLEKGEAKEYGFDGTASKVSKFTDGDGYAKTDFNFGKGFAEFTIWIRWKRGGQIIEDTLLKATSPLLLRLYRFGKGAPGFAFDAALKLFDEGGDVAGAVKGFPKKKDENDSTITLRAVAGLLDNERAFVKDETLEFKSSKGKVDPDKDKTKAFGIARTEVSDITEDALPEITVSVEKKFVPVARPPEQKATAKEQSKKSERFTIGTDANPFVVVMDEAFNPDEPVTGGGKLELVAGGNEVMKYLKEVKLEVNDINLSDNSGELLALEGEVTWKADDNAKITVLGLEFQLSAFTILAQKGARIEGTVKHSSFEKSLKFSAELDADGNFLGSVEDLPEIKVKGFTLKKGTAFDIDMHSGKSPGSMEASFEGILVRTAKLELPEVFNGADKEPSSLEVENFYIGTRYSSDGERSMGFGGKASLTGSFLKMGYAGYELAVQEFSLEFENSELNAGSFAGTVNLPIPFEGSVQVAANFSSEEWKVGASTETPVTLPNLGLSMTFQKGSCITYNTAEKKGTVTINAFMVTKQIGEVEIKGFDISSDGSIKVNEITLEKSVKFGSGFDLHAKSISFAFSNKEYSLTVKGGFGFPAIGIKELMGSISIKDGPSLSVTFDKAEINFDHDPVTFKGKFTYNGKEFNGQFDIGIKKILPNGISGRFVVGNTEGDAGFSYWYAELKVGVKIPIGQTGLMLLALGGGVGYHYLPPIGASEGSPASNIDFALKAMIEMGTAPGGEVFAGRMEMVLIPGMFSLYGKTWLLTQQEAIYGEGQLNLHWDPQGKVDGYIGMFIGLPNAEGGIFLASGKINFEFISPSDFTIKSENLKGSVLKTLNAEGNIDINSSYLDLGGKLFYNTNKSISLGVVGAKVSLNVTASAALKYMYKTSTLNSAAKFNGDWDVDLETPFGNADIISGNINLDAELKATPSSVEINASANISYDIWFYKDTVKLDLGYKSNL